MMNARYRMQRSLGGAAAFLILAHGIPACRPRDLPPVSSALTARMPCRERLIIRNGGVEDRAYRVELSSGSFTGTARGRLAGSNHPYASTIIALPRTDDSVISLTSEARSITLESRDERPCVRAGEEADIAAPADDYLIYNASIHASDGRIVPGVVSVDWKSGAAQVEIDSLVVRSRASLIGKRINPNGTSTHYYWFDSDSTGTVAIEKAQAFKRSGLVTSAAPIVRTRSPIP